MTTRSRAVFDRAIVDSRNLIRSHKSLKTGPGRRTYEMSLNRAIVVLTVAAWQAYLEALTLELLGTLKPTAAVSDVTGAPSAGFVPGLQQWKLLDVEVRSATGRFSTPDAQRTRDLLQRVGYDPLPQWGWGSGAARVDGDDASRLLDRWLKVRNTIAHGSALPTFRNPSGPLHVLKSGSATLQLQDAESCVSFFTHLVDSTEKGVGPSAGS